MKPHEIESKSFEIIRSRLGDYEAPEAVLDVVIRIAHTTGDVEFAKRCTVPEASVRAGVEALRAGGNVVTDVEMVRTGIRSAQVERLGGKVLCFLNDPQVAERARSRGTTRSAAAMVEAADHMEGGVVAIGNAPTALFALCDMVEAGTSRPALIVGVPVGFVGAAESKERLTGLDIPYITVLGERGGSPIAAAAVNALIKRAGG